MELKGVIFTLQHLIVASAGARAKAAGTIAPSLADSRNLFAADIFPVIVDKKLSENVVYSPASIQTCLALAFAGAEGETAKEMRKVLRFGDKEKTEIFQNYGDFLKSAFKSTNPQEPQLKMANRIYVNNNLEVSAKFNEIAKDTFDTLAKYMNFKKAKSAVKKINNWVKHKTENRIKNLLQSDDVNGDTSAVLVNAIYFKAKWLNPFSVTSTRKWDFHVSPKKTLQVDTMHTDGKFAYADLPQLDATALEMPYENSDISMLIILPKQVDGLEQLETKLKGLDLNEISSKMLVANMDVYLPKFRIEYEINLNQHLEKMGLSTMFSDDANFTGLFESFAPQSISNVKHKAFLDVNEAGSEAAAATVMVNLFKNARRVFRVNHPFVFAIRSKTAVYFTGHVAEF